MIRFFLATISLFIKWRDQMKYNLILLIKKQEVMQNVISWSTTLQEFATTTTNIFIKKQMQVFIYFIPAQTSSSSSRAYQINTNATCCIIRSLIWETIYQLHKTNARRKDDDVHLNVLKKVRNVSGATRTLHYVFLCTKCAPTSASFCHLSLPNKFTF